jgi:hypothetical protein
LFSRGGRGGECVAWIVPGLAVACAPSQSFRPAGSLDHGRTSEVGLALSSVEKRPYVDEPTQRIGQAWFSERLDERWSLTAIGAFDTTSVLGGAALRWDAVSGQRISLAGELEVGLFWAGAAIPASVRLWRSVSVYTAPRLSNWGPEVTPFIPAGVSAEIAGTVVLRAEAQLSWAGFQYYNRRLHWGLAVAHEW